MTGMHEPRAQVVLIVRAFEELDRDGRVLPLHARDAATRRALMVTGLADWQGKLSDAWTFSNGETVFRRARLLFDGLRRKHRALTLIFRAARKGSGILPVLVLSAFALGLAASLLLPGRPPGRIPYSLLGLGAWNLTMLTCLVLGRFVPRVRRPLATRFTALFVRVTLWRALARWRKVAGESAEARITAEALMRFAALWHRAAERLLDSRARLVLHLGATVLGAGAVAGLFLREEAVGAWQALGVALLVVLLPRVGMGLFEMRRAAKLAETIPVSLQSPYYRRVFAAWRGARKKVEILPHGYRPQAGAMAALRTLLHDFFGARAGVRVFDPLEAGSPPPAMAEGPGEHELCRVVLFDLDDAPRAEVQGAFIRALRRDLDPDRDRALVFLDCSGVTARRATRAQRDALTQGWREIVRTAGMKIVELSLHRPVGDFNVTDEMIAAVRAGLWPQPAEKREA